MRPFVIRPASCLKGEIFLPGDKSIAHRAIIISALAGGKTKIENFPASKDCLSTIKSVKRLGIKVKKVSSSLSVLGRGLYGFRKPGAPIFVGDSGTTLRLLLGALAGQHFKATLVAGKSLSRRPMLRVTKPLRMMGAEIKAKAGGQNVEGGTQKVKLEEFPPVTIKGGDLLAVNYKMPVASAQVKSAILLAALFANGKTRVTEFIPTRDHTERMLKLFKAQIKINKSTITLQGRKELASPGIITIPGDLSSAAFFVVPALITPNSRVIIRNVSLNPSRAGILRALKRMGADIKIKTQKAKVKSYEPAGDLLIQSSELKGIRIRKEEVPSLIDELPILMVAACYAKSGTIIEGVSELRVKETDRINSMTENLKKMGAQISVFKSGGLENIKIAGSKNLHGARVASFGDHRTAMSMVVAGLATAAGAVIDDVSCISKSFPGFLSLLGSLRH